MATECTEPLRDDVLIGIALRGMSAAMFVILAKPIQQFAKRLATVRHRKFFFRAQLRESLAERRIKEKRVVAKPTRAARRFEDVAVGAALRDRQDTTALGQGDDADVVRRTLRTREPEQLAQQLVVTGRVVRGGTRLACRTNALRAAPR